MAKSRGEDYFEKLPQDLLVIVFSKLLVNSSISDLKFLFRCSLVSKRFNSSISTTISSIQTLSLTNNIDATASVPKIKKKILEKIMGKFHNLRSFYIEFNELESDLKWKAVYRSGIYCFVALRLKSESEGVLPSLKRICEMMKFHELMVLFIRKLKMLNSVVIADSKKQGKISFGDKLLKELRNNLKYNGEAFRLPAYVQSCVVPELCVPLFGSSQKPVEFLIIKIENEARRISRGGLDDNDDIMNWDFDDEEKEFGEALTKILRDHKNQECRSKIHYHIHVRENPCHGNIIFL